MRPKCSVKWLRFHFNRMLIWSTDFGTNIIFANCTGQGIADRKTAKEKFLYLSKKAKLMEKNENVKKELGMH